MSGTHEERLAEAQEWQRQDEQGPYVEFLVPVAVFCVVCRIGAQSVAEQKWLQGGRAFLKPAWPPEWQPVNGGHGGRCPECAKAIVEPDRKLVLS